jgi:HK97 family phage major capsid protein
MTDDNLIYYGAAVKDLGGGKVGGYLVRWSGPQDTDTTGDFFTNNTDLGVSEGSSLPVYYQHGYDSQLKSKRIGRGQAKFDDVGLWFEAQLELRDEYERAIYELAQAGKLGWSSGAAGHLVEREQIGKAWHIKSWPIAEASLTPTPAEPRNSAIPIKSLAGAVAQPEDNAPSPPIEPEKENNLMDEQKFTELLEGAVGKLSSTVDEKIKAFTDSLPEIKAGYSLEVTKDEADKAVEEQPFTAGEFFKAVRVAAESPSMMDKRLKAMKAPLGLNEAVPSGAGFLLPVNISDGIYQNMFPVGSILSLMRPTPISGNALTINAIDETSRATGSRLGGVQGYWLAEASTKTSSKPKFRQIDLKLKKVAALCYATDEILEDVTYMAAWLNAQVPNELRFLVEDSFINGDGVAKPLGILASPALVSATRLDANKIQTVDVLGMWARRLVGMNDYVWLANQNITPQLMTMTVGQMPVYLPPGGLSGSQYGSLFGRPVIETEYSPALGSVGDLLLASPSAYAAIDKGGAVQAAQSIHVQFVSDQTAFRFVYRVDGQPLLNSAITPFKGTDTHSAFVALAATT